MQEVRGSSPLSSTRADRSFLTYTLSRSFLRSFDHLARISGQRPRFKSRVGDGPILGGGRCSMVDKSSESPVRIIGSRELHQNLPGILRELENENVRYVLTVHGKPRAVLVGAEPYLNMVLDGKSPSEALVGLQLSALLGGNLNAMPLDDLEKALGPKSC